MATTKFTAEQDFIKKLEAYFNIKYDIYSKNRIALYLKEFKESDSPVIEKVFATHQKVRTVTKFMVIDKSKLPLCTQEAMESEAIKICEKYKVPYDKFVLCPLKKSSCTISDARKEFCRIMLTRYNTERKQIQEFLHVHHSSIVTYLKIGDDSIFYKEAI